MTTATDRLVMIASFGAIAEKSGMLHSGMPGSTAASVCTPHSLTGRKRVISAPAAISATAIGNFGITFFDTRRIKSAVSPITREGRLIVFKVSAMCSASSKSSPTPAVPPISFGTCISMIVVQIPVINPPITGAEIKLTSFRAFI